MARRTSVDRNLVSDKFHQMRIDVTPNEIDSYFSSCHFQLLFPLSNSLLRFSVREIPYSSLMPKSAGILSNRHAVIQGAAPEPPDFIGAPQSESKLVAIKRSGNHLVTVCSVSACGKSGLAFQGPDRKEICVYPLAVGGRTRKT